MSVWPHGVPRVGDRASMSRTVPAEDIASFTDLSGDRNPLHYDRELAASTRFGGIVVQGGVTSAILNAVVAERLPGPGSVFLEVAGGSPHRSGPATRSPARSRSLGVREDKPITTLATRVVRGDGVVALEGTAVCSTRWLSPDMPRPDRRARGGTAGPRRRHQ